MKSLKDIYTGKIYANNEVLAAAPRNKVQGEIELFTLGKYVTDDELEKEYESRGLVPADVFAVGAWSEENTDKEYVATHWKNAQGKWCFAAFRRWYDERSVDVSRGDLDWYGGWWFAGVRKSSALESSEQSSDTLSLEHAIRIVKAAGYKVIKEV